MSDIITVRDLDIVTTEIKTIERNIAQGVIYGYIEIGKRLTEAKEMVGHGGWGKYLEERIRYSQQWATNLMNLYKEYGDQQTSLFESFANSQAFGNIDVTKHILLLGVPAEERAAFAAEHDPEKLSTRELQAAIRERDANLQAAQEQSARADRAEEKAVEMGERVKEMENQLDRAGDKLAEAELLQKAHREQIEKLQADVKAANDKATAATGKVDQLKQQLKTAKDAEKAAKDALAEAKAKPEIPEAMMEEMRQQVAADAAAKATAELQKQLDAAQIAADEAEQRRKAAEAQVAEAERKANISSPDMVLVSTYLQGTQEQFNKMIGALKKVILADPETGARLKKNVKAKLLENMNKAIDAV